MANPEHLAILKQGVEEWNKWRMEQSDVMPDLSEADLYAADLSGANLRDADLREADTRAASFFRADRRGELARAKRIP